MKKFIIQAKDKINIAEVECQAITALDDPSINWLPHTDKKYRVLSIKEKDGTSPVWFNHAIYDTLEEARTKCAELIKQNFEFNLKKYNTEYTPEQVELAIAEITLTTKA